MSKVKQPLLGIGAVGSVGNQLTFQKTPGGHKAYAYTKPGARTPSPATPSQLDQRGIVGLIMIRWQSMTPEERAVWNTRATAERYHGAGYHLFLHEAQLDLLTNLGLAAYWSMNHVVGGQVEDLSGNGNNGNLLPTYPTDCPTLVPGQNPKFGQAASNWSNTRYINCGHGPVIAALAAYSLEAWIQFTPAGRGAYRGFVSHFTNEPTHGWNICANSDDHIYFRAISTASAQYVISDSSYIDTLWHHVVATATLDIGQLYIDAVRQDDSMSCNPPDEGQDTLIGIYSPGDNPMYGLIDEARIWNRALGQDEIRRLYHLFRPEPVHTAT